MPPTEAGPRAEVGTPPSAVEMMGASSGRAWTQTAAARPKALPRGGQTGTCGTGTARLEVAAAQAD